MKTTRVNRVQVVIAVLLVGLIAATVYFTRRPTDLLVGTWVNETRVIDAPAGEVEIRFHADGTGTVRFDQSRFHWLFQNFRYEHIGDQLHFRTDDGDYESRMELNGDRLSLSFSLDGDETLNATFRRKD